MAATLCGVCAEAYDNGEHRALLLPCLHMTCALCVGDMVRLAAERDAKPAACLECHEPFSSNQVSLSNHFFVSDNTGDNPGSNKSGSAAFTIIRMVPRCTPHGDNVTFMCDKCLQLVCLRCVVEDELHRGHVCLSLQQAKVKYDLIFSQTKPTLAAYVPGVVRAKAEIARMRTRLDRRRTALDRAIDDAARETKADMRREKVHAKRVLMFLSIHLKSIDDPNAEPIPEDPPAPPPLRPIRITGFLCEEDARADEERTRREEIINEAALKASAPPDDYENAPEIELEPEVEEVLREAAVHIDERAKALKAQAHVELDAEIKTTQLQQEALDLFHGWVEAAGAMFLALTEPPPFGMEPPVAAHVADLLTVKARFVTLEQMEPSFMPISKDTVKFYANRIFRPLDVRPTLALYRELGHVGRERDYSQMGKPLKIIGRFGYDVQHFDHATGVAQLTNGNLALGDCKNKRVQIYTLEGRFVRSVNVGSDVFHLAAAQDGGFWVTSYTSEHVSRYSASFELLKRWRVLSALGVTVAPDGTLLVACWNTNCVEAYSADSYKIKWRSTVADNPINQFPHNLRGVAATSTEVFVCCQEFKRIDVMALASGQKLRRIAEGRIRLPRSVAVIPDTDKLVIADGAHILILAQDTGREVFQFGKTGKLPGQLMVTDGQVTVLDDGRLLVGDTSNHRFQFF